MKITFFLTFGMTTMLSHAAVTVTSVNNVTSLAGTNVTTTGNTVDFVTPNAGNGSDQGSGIAINVSNTLVPSSNPVLYFQFDTTVMAGLETNFFYGQATTSVANSGPSNSDQNAFSVGINDMGTVFARNNGQIVDFSTLTNLSAGTAVSYEIVLTTSGSYSFSYDVTASYFDTVAGSVIEETLTNISGNQNPQGDVSNYNFHAIGTRGIAVGDSFDVTNFTASDMPISIPEPSTSIMILAASSLFMLRRRRA